jgi:hypothetical protein
VEALRHHEPDGVRRVGLGPGDEIGVRKKVSNT